MSYRELDVLAAAEHADDRAVQDADVGDVSRPAGDGYVQLARDARPLRRERLGRGDAFAFEFGLAALFELHHPAAGASSPVSDRPRSCVYEQVGAACRDQCPSAQRRVGLGLDRLQHAAARRAVQRPPMRTR